MAAQLRNAGSGATLPGGRQPRPLLLGRGRGTILHRLETPGSLGRGWGRDVGKGAAFWLREGEVVQGRSGREVKVKDILGREVGSAIIIFALSVLFCKPESTTCW